MLTIVLSVVVILAFLIVLRMRRSRPDLFGLTLTQGLSIPFQAVLGGITVLSGLNPLRRRIALSRLDPPRGADDPPRLSRLQRPTRRRADHAALVHRDRRRHGRVRGRDGHLRRADDRGRPARGRQLERQGARPPATGSTRSCCRTCTASPPTSPSA
ncbi:MAG: hypothetical protein WDM88_08040 [Galbitalea sp.]